MRLPSKSGNSEVELLVQFFPIAAHQVGHLHVLEMMPAAFIPQVEIGGMAGRASSQILPPALETNSVTTARRWMGEPSQITHNSARPTGRRRRTS